MPAAKWKAPVCNGPAPFDELFAVQPFGRRRRRGAGVLSTIRISFIAAAVADLGGSPMVLKSKEVAEDGSPMWDVLLQEAPSEPRRKPETKEETQPEAQAAAAPYSAKQLPDDAIPF